jgi:hypothetical protein
MFRLSCLIKPSLIETSPSFFLNQFQGGLGFEADVL